ncbi:hypothetical protein KCU74_g105, partial [Aureobasidium melanogenum]
MGIWRNGLQIFRKDLAGAHDRGPLGLQEATRLNQPPCRTDVHLCIGMPTWVNHVLPRDETLGLAGNQVDGDMRKRVCIEESKDKLLLLTFLFCCDGQKLECSRAIGRHFSSTTEEHCLGSEVEAVFAIRRWLVSGTARQKLHGRQWRIVRRGISN